MPKIREIESKVHLRGENCLYFARFFVSFLNSSRCYHLFETDLRKRRSFCALQPNQEALKCL